MATESTRSERVLSIGSLSFAGSPGERRWERPLAEVEGRLRSVDRKITSPPRVNVMFRLLSPDHPAPAPGVRAGRYFSGKRLLLVEVYVEPGVSGSATADDVVALLSEAVDEAERHARRRKLTDQPLTAQRNLTDSLKAGQANGLVCVSTMDVEPSQAV